MIDLGAKPVDGYAKVCDCFVRLKSQGLKLLVSHMRYKRITAFGTLYLRPLGDFLFHLAETLEILR
jgi:hypothetical protein